MTFKEKLEDKIQKTEKKLLELSLNIKRMDREYQSLLEEMAITPEQIQNAENEKDFSPPIWVQLQNEKKKLDDQLKLELSSLVDLSKTKKTLAERGAIQQHWLFVR